MEVIQLEEKKLQKSKSHNIIIENRQRLSLSGVVEVESFNDEYILLETELGLLIIRGNSLKINKLSLESAELLVEGNIISCEYTEDEQSGSKNGFWSKLFR